MKSYIISFRILFSQYWFLARGLEFHYWLLHESSLIIATIIIMMMMIIIGMIIDAYFPLVEKPPSAIIGGVERENHYHIYPLKTILNL